MGGCLSEAGLDLVGECRGCNPPPPHVKMTYNWYSVLNFVYVTSQLHHSLMVPPPEKNPGSAPVSCLLKES